MIIHTRFLDSIAIIIRGNHFRIKIQFNIVKKGYNTYSTLYYFITIRLKLNTLMQYYTVVILRWYCFRFFLLCQYLINNVKRKTAIVHRYIWGIRIIISSFACKNSVCNLWNMTDSRLKCDFSFDAWVLVWCVTQPILLLIVNDTEVLYISSSIYFVCASVE